jgi:glycogen(starch) synthase
MIKATSAGVFPSYYEPWGYTPVETAANGALAITTDMAGFGRWLEEETEAPERKGIRVLKRRDVSDQDAAERLAEMLEDISSYSKTEITERKHNARRLAQLTSWTELGENYREAHRIAAENHG